MGFRGLLYNPLNPKKPDQIPIISLRTLQMSNGANSLSSTKMKKKFNFVRKSNLKIILPLSVMIILAFILLIQGCRDFIGPTMNDVIATLSTNKRIYSVGEEIEMTLVLRNRSDESVSLGFNDGQTYDFIIKKLPEDKEVWRWSEGKFFTEALWFIKLEPYEKKTYVFKWDQKDNESRQVESGTYKLEALISSEPEVFANSVRINIEDAKQSPEFETIDKGTQSGYNKRASLVIKDQAEWENVWNLHTSNLDQIPRVPKVDFNTDMVIAIFRGEFPSSGFYTEITNITESKDKIEVTVTETNDLKGMLLDVMTYPYHIVKLRRSDLPVEFTYKIVIH